MNIGKSKYIDFWGFIKSSDLKLSNSFKFGNQMKNHQIRSKINHKLGKLQLTVESYSLDGQGELQKKFIEEKQRCFVKTFVSEN